MEDEKIENLEITKELKSLSDLAIDNSEVNDDKVEENNIFEPEIISDEETNNQSANETVNDEEINFDEPDENKSSEKKPKKENKLLKKWKSLSKKKKIIVIVSLVIIFLLIIGLILYFVVFKDDEEEVEPTSSVVLEMDNYRYENGTLILLDNGVEVGTYECTNKDENLCQVAMISQDTTIDTTTMVDEDGEYLSLRSSIYYDRYVFILDTSNESVNQIYLYDIEDEKTLQTVFAVITTYDYDDYFILKNDSSEYGLIKVSEDEVSTVIPYSYDEIHIMPNQDEVSLVSVRKNNNSYIANLENVVLTKSFNNTIVNANSSYVIAIDSANKYHVYDYNAKEINSSIDMDYVTLLDEVMLVVSDNKLYVYDYEENLYSNQDLSLKNTYYNPVEVYTDLVLTSTKKAFDYTYNAGVIIINIYDGDSKTNYNVNVYEGKLSSSISYLSYLDGYLYIYSDAEKKSLIGTYECSNKNSIDSSTTELTNCTIASDSIYKITTGNTKETNNASSGMIPIINNQYVFIKDGETIYLYDLKNAKSLANYKSVDTGSYTGGNEVTFVTTSSLYFIGESKSSGSFGVAVITVDGVNPFITFDKTSISKLGDYYVVLESDLYYLYSSKNSNVKETEGMSSLIVDYNGEYLKTYKNEMYFVHSFDDKFSDSNAYNYIELYDDYYAVVLNGKVHLYSYDNDGIEYIYESDGEEKTNGITLNLTTYYGSDVNAFKITFDSSYIYVQIGNSNNTYGSKMKFSKTVTTTEGDSEDDE